MASDIVMDSKLCSNCQRDIIATNYVIHQVYCERNLTLCPKCDEPILKREFDSHQKELHDCVSCSECHSSMEKRDLDQHLSNVCTFRKVTCSFCNIQLCFNDLGSHEEVCGSRTEKCPDCGEYVMLRCRQLHLDSNHSFIRFSGNIPPSESWQNGHRNLGNFLAGLASSTNHQSKRTNVGRMKKQLRNKRTVEPEQGEASASGSSDFLDFDSTSFQNLDEMFQSSMSSPPPIVGSSPQTVLSGEMPGPSTGAISKMSRRGAGSLDRMIKKGATKSVLWPEDKKLDESRLNRKENIIAKLDNVKKNPLLSKKKPQDDTDMLLALQLAEEKHVASKSNTGYRNTTSPRPNRDFQDDDDEEFLINHLPTIPENEISLPTPSTNVPNARGLKIHHNQVRNRKKVNNTDVPLSPAARKRFDSVFNAETGLTEHGRPGVTTRSQLATRKSPRSGNSKE